VAKLYATNDIEDVLKANTKQLRIREIELELERSNPVEEYYLSNMDLLNEYY